MNNMMEIGFWLDLGQRIKGSIGNLFRWVFATKRRLQMVILALIVLATLWGCGKIEAQRQALANAAATGTSATAAAAACAAPDSSTPAEQAAAQITINLCSASKSSDRLRAAASRALTVPVQGSTATAPDPALVERFAFHLPNSVKQIGGADAAGKTTVLATSSAAQFLLSFDPAGTLVGVEDITEISDATPTPTPAPGSVGAPTAVPQPTATTAATR